MFSYRSICSCLVFATSQAFADPSITEFMASNQNSIVDEDGFAADWIEIYNPDATAVDMDGWALTDDASQLQKWIFPAIVIPPKSFIVVYASSKNRRTVGQPLHTNFAISAGGEYLALVKPDGTTKATEFAPGFPAQFGDISYGTAFSSSEEVAIGLGSAVKAKVPIDNSDGNAWRASDFNDDSWLTGTLAAGYFNFGGTSAINLTPRLGFDLSTQMGGQATTAYFRIPFGITDANMVNSLKLRMNYDDGFVAFINEEHVASSASAPAFESLAYNSGASTQHSPQENENSYEEIDLSSAIGALDNGNNLLAIHGLNAGTTSSDFFMEAKLIVGFGGPGGGEIGFFREATPGSANGGHGSLQLPQKIIYSRPSGPFTGTVSVAITGAVAGQQIRYVIADPSGTPNANVADPTMTSTLYTGPINVSSSKVIRAAVFDPTNGQHSGTKTAQYLSLETDTNNNTSNFTSPLPIAIVDQHGGGGYGPGEPYKTSFFYTFEPAGGISTLNSTPSLFTRVGHKVRGSSSAHFPKRAYGMKPWTESNENQKVDILGLASDSSWVWYNPWKFDDAYVRNAFMFQLSRDMGRWASRTQPVEMFLNVNGGKLDYTDYHGVYVLTEKIESGKDRLDITTIEKGDTEGDAVTGAYILKIDRADEDETNWTTTMAQAGSEDRIVIVEPEQEDEKPEQVAYIKNYIAAFESALQADRDSNWQTRNYRKYIDVPSWIDVHMLNSFALNPDSFRLSSYFHKERNEKLKAGPIWDFDRGLFADKDAGQTQDQPRQWNGTHFDMSWWRHVWRDPEFIQAWVDRWWELRPGPMSDTHLNNIITTMGNEIGNTAGARDAARWPGEEGNTPESGSYLGEIATLRDWLTSSTPGSFGRTNWIDTQVPHPPVTSQATGKVAAGTTVTLSNIDGAESIRYRLNGTDPRPEGGGNSAASLYNSPLVINQTTVLRARRYKQGSGGFTPFPHNLNTRWSAPVTRVYLVNEDFATATDLTISEIHYDPTDPTTGERATGIEMTASKFEYVELRNTGNRTINTFGIQFVDGMPFKGISLEPLTLAPGGFALVVKNREAFLSRHGQSLAPMIVGEWTEGLLSNEGENLRILARDGSTIHDSTYNAIAGNGASLANSGGGFKKDVPSPGALGPTYSQWKNFHFPAGGSASDDDADGDLDDAGNLLEYSRGTDPSVAENQLGHAPVFTLVNDGASSRYVFTHPLDRPSAIYQVEFSDDLEKWEDIASTLVAAASGMETREVNLSVASGSPASKFLRLKTVVKP